MDNSNKHLRWLHISDLHAGQDTQDWLWPTLQTNFFDDLDRIIPSMGGVDLVIFSGDLTQRGTSVNFDTLERLLGRLWEQFDKYGCKPSLFMVPGNHDLVRPDPYDPITAALRSWWENGNVKEAFWKSQENSYRTFINNAFSNYTCFRRRLIDSGFPLCTGTEGALPGDTSCVLVKDELRLGLVGLNSTYLQLFDADGPKLDLDVRQLLAVTGGDPDAWCRANHINLLITHHPESWLAEPALRHLHGEIYPPGRFTAHLYGHMHEPSIQSRRDGGSAERNSFQAASLYGLRKYGAGKIDRVHGYTGARLELDAGRIRVWPRIDTVVGSGARRFAPDISFDLSEQNNFELGLGNLAGLQGSAGLGVVPPTRSFGNPQQEAAMAAQGAAPEMRSHPLRSAIQHAAVRRIEQRKLKAAIEARRVAWLSADWGYAADDFISSVLATLPSPMTATYRLDLQDYTDRESFFAKFALQTGYSFQEFCKSISGVDRVLLLLEDVPVSRSTAPESAAWEEEISGIVNATLEYCTNSVVILVSRQLPNSVGFATVEIKPLDEADVQAYLLNHPQGGASLAGPNEVSEILRLTGGLPVEIDSILRELEFISLPELVELRLTSPRPAAGAIVGHDGLLPVIESLRNSPNPDVARAFGLLVALSAFPYGETLARVKRFDPQFPFYPLQAAILADRGLIEPVVSALALEGKYPGANVGRKLVAKQVVRQTVESILSPVEIDLRNGRAAAIYFGDKWNVGEPRSIRSEDLKKALGGDGGLGNPHAVINALLQRAVEVDDSTRLSRAVLLARLFIANLSSGDNYRSSVTACLDFLKLIPDTGTYADDRNWLKYNLSRCQRMLGQRDLAINLYEELENVKLERRTKQRLLLNWALALQHTNQAKAKEIAGKVVSLGKATFSAMQAESLILQLSSEDPNRFQKLRDLEARARGKKAVTTANTIAFFLANNSNGPVGERRAKLLTIAASAKRNNDPYSAAQAIVEIAGLVKNGAEGLTPDELSGLIEAYHYLYNERIGTLFHRCHDGLWRHFYERSDVENLLRLFRHSSFIWRIYGEDSREQSYIEQLASLLSRGMPTESAEGTYLMVRAERLQITLEA
ncbi:metallophosphoesterase family protein [Cupriavidus plantarum]|uniref:metallophosphoesterase family protein n=1 Tax=Cupriavidus plantarum TaxID=942865 RepID=UPI001B16D596|nr:metallophosphoesterase [Cupriavidus plantarum]CAG2138951.1 3',5'-cyclic adenosine monophosphate phosphodiesterase CpdA [Cupriavidus plantarum]SMR85791.1 Calcineurin-like phosphoesterase [Cupriavidus plantarum]